jgi:hypothetical protein
MSKKICFLYTDTNGLHNTSDIVSKKNLYNFGRLIALHYSIGTYDINSDTNISQYNESIRVNTIIKPDTINFDKEALRIHNITYEYAVKNGISNRDVIQQFKNDIKDVDIIISHSLPFYLKSIQVECFRTATIIDFTKYTLIDVMTFGHDYKYPKLNSIMKKLKIKNIENQLDQIIQVFLKLYENSITTMSKDSASLSN